MKGKTERPFAPFQGQVRCRTSPLFNGENTADAGIACGYAAQKSVQGIYKGCGPLVDINDCEGGAPCVTRSGVENTPRASFRPHFRRTVRCKDHFAAVSHSGNVLARPAVRIGDARCLRGLALLATLLRRSDGTATIGSLGCSAF